MLCILIAMLQYSRLIVFVKKKFKSKLLVNICNSILMLSLYVTEEEESCLGLKYLII